MRMELWNRGCEKDCATGDDKRITEQLMKKDYGTCDKKRIMEQVMRKGLLDS